MPEMTMDQLRERMHHEHSKLYLVVMQPTDKYDIASDEGRELMRRHLNWQFSMEDRGILLGAGPFNTLGEAQTQQQFRAKAAVHSHMLNASGMYIIGAASLEAAEAIAQTEPFEIKGWRKHTTVLWNLNEGVAWQVARKLVESVQGSTA
jgi:uncharacterized protein YciI